MQYKLINAGSREKLVEWVTEHIGMGWSPQGGVATSFSYDENGNVRTWYLQAMWAPTIIRLPNE